MNTHTEAVSLLLAKRALDGVPVVEVYPPGYDRLRPVFLNGNLDAWSGGDPDSYSINEAGGSIVEGTADADVHTLGGSSAICTKTSQPLVSFIQDIKNINTPLTSTQGLTPGKWYHASGWTKVDGVMTGLGPYLRIFNQTTGTEYLQLDGTWSSVVTNHLINPTMSTDWVRFSVWFQIPTTFGSTDAVRWTIRENSSTVGIYYLDDLNVQGPFERPALFYSKQALTFQGDTYTSRIVKSGPYRDSLKPIQPRGTVDLANADRPLRPYMEPEDLISGGRIYHRLVFLDASSGFAPTGDSQIFWQGVAKRPRRGTDKSVTITAVGRLNPRKIPVPGRRFSHRCQVRKFGDGVDCLYTTTTTTTNGNEAPAAPSALPSVTDGTLLVDGQTIEIGNSGPVTIVSGGGTGALTVTPVINWKVGDIVRYTQCDRTFESCTKRVRTQEFQGFRLVDVVTGIYLSSLGSSVKASDLEATGNPLGLDILEHLAGYPGIFGTPKVTAGSRGDPSKVVPFLIGRRWIEGKLVEEISVVQSGAEKVNIKIIVLSEGGPAGIGDVLRARDDEEPFPNDLDTGRLISGTYWRAGGIGITGDEDDAAYDGDPGGAVPDERPQNIDLATSTGTTMSRTAYAIVYRKADEDSGSGDDGKYRFDTFGIKLQKYLATGAVDGSPLTLPSGIWGCVMLATTKRFGFDLTPGDIDMAVAKPAADYCATEITSLLAVTRTSGGSTGTEVTVLSVRGFFPGQKVDVGGDTGLTILDVHQQVNQIVLTTSITYADDEVVQGYPLRFESHWSKSDSGDGLKAINQLLASCAGFMAQDHGSGKVQFDTERDTVSDIMLNGDFDIWGGGVPQNWAAGTGGTNTITEETTIVHTAGGSSVLMTRNSAGELRLIQSAMAARFQAAGAGWYLATCWVQVSSASTFGFGRFPTKLPFELRVRANPFGTGLYWDGEASPPDWTSSNSPAVRVAGRVGEWVKLYAAFKMPQAYLDEGGLTVQVEFHNLGDETIGEDLLTYVDDFKIEGPLEGYYRDTDDNWPAAETITGGDMETWAAGVPTPGWGKIQLNGGLVEEDLVTFKTGAGAAKCTSGTGTYLQFNFAELMPGREYELTLWQFYPTQAAVFSGAPDVQIFSHQTNNYCEMDGKTWSGGRKSCYQPGLQGDHRRDLWTFHTVRFTVETDHEVWQSIQIRIRFDEPGAQVTYLDDISIRGPIDRIPLSQPGMGILKGSFRWLNDDDERRDFNQFAVSYSDEAKGGKDVIHEVNDYARQDRDGVVKRHEVTLDAVAHEVHAARIAKLNRDKLIASGSGAKIQVPWYGLLAQPGGVVAIRHEAPGWTGALKRITKRDIQGIGARAELTTKLDVQDYREASYQQDADPDGDDSDLTPGASTLDLIIDSFSQAGVGIIGGKAVHMHWENANPISLGTYTTKWYRSTVTGFTPGPTNRFQGGISATGQQAIYQPTEAETGGSLFFVVKVFFPSGYSLMSDEEEVLVTGVTNPGQDPTSTEYTPGNNLIIRSEINEFNGSPASGWFGSGPVATLTSLKPTDHEPVTEFDNEMQNAGNAIDGALGSDAGTFAGAFVTTQGFVHGNDFFFTGTPPGVFRKGYYACKSEVTGGLPGKNEGKFMYSMNGAAGPWYDFHFVVNLPGASTLLGPFHGGEFDDLRIRACGYKLGTANMTFRVWDIVFNAVVNASNITFMYGGALTLCSDGITAQTIEQILPTATMSMVQDGTFFVFSCFVRSWEDVPDARLFVKIKSATEDFQTILALDWTDHILATGWRRFATRVKLSDGFKQGPFTLQFKTESTKYIQIVRPMLTVGQQVFAWGVHQSESHPLTPFPFGDVANFTPGPWTDTMIRIAEVTP